MILPLDTFLSASTNDMVSEFVSWRTYLAESLPHGHLPLWNSITYGGYPFLGGFESAVLYPPNLLSLSLPAHASCAQFFDAPPSRDSRMGNRSDGPGVVA